MKKCIALLMVLTMLLAAQAGAESLPYMGQLAQGRSSSINETLLTTESYPEVCLSPYLLSAMYCHDWEQPLFLRFPCPEDTFAYSVELDRASFIDMSTDCRFVYSIDENGSYELFLNRCADERLIVADGGEGYAIYIAPQWNEAYILIGVDEIERGVKLEIMLDDDRFEAMTDKQKNPKLAEWALSEARRVMDSMRVERMDTYWSAGRYQGITMLSTYIPGDALTYTLSEMPDLGGFSASAPWIAEVTDRGFKLIAIYDKTKMMEIEVNTTEFPPHTQTMREEEPASVFTFDTPDGASYDVYMNWYDDIWDDSQHCYHAYVSRAIGAYDFYGTERNVSLTIELHGSSEFDNKLEWTSAEELTEYLKQFLSGFKVTTGNDVPTYLDAQPYSAAGAAPEATVTPTPTPVPATPTPTPVPEAATPETGADAVFTFRNGLHWGMTPEEVLAAEGESEFYGQVQLNDHVVGRTLPVKLSKFAVAGVYFFVDNRLAMVEFPYSDNDAGVADYLGKALEQVYGEAEKDAPILSQLATAITAVRGNIDGYTNAAYGWFFPSGTAIQLFKFNGGFDLYYADGTVDVDTVMATPTPSPTPSPYDTYGL